MAVTRLFRKSQQAILAADTVVLNPTFAGSAPLGGADADLIVDGRVCCRFG